MPRATKSIQLEGIGSDVEQYGDPIGLWERSNSQLVVTPNDNMTASPVTGWSWAGAPFGGAPSLVTASTSTYWRFGSTAIANYFLYKTYPGGTAYVMMGAYDGIYPENGAYAMLRIDDGTDNNYVMAGDQYVITGSVADTNKVISIRTGGGAVTTTTILTKWPTLRKDAVQLAMSGSLFTNWAATAYWFGRDSQGLWLAGVGSGLTWTPTRWGFYFTSLTTADWQSMVVDWIHWI